MLGMTVLYACTCTPPPHSPCLYQTSPKRLSLWKVITTNFPTHRMAQECVEVCLPSPMKTFYGAMFNWQFLVHLNNLKFQFLTERRCAGQLSRYSDWLRAGRSGIESRWARDFPLVQTGPGAHPTSCKMSTGSFPGGRVQLGRAADHSPPSSAAVIEE